MLDIYIDADGCPVKEEVYKVAARYALNVRVVCNRATAVPPSPRVQLVVVGRGSDEADKWIAATCGPGDIVITADLPLAARCIDNGARVVTPRGRSFDADTIGDALATRDLMTTLRSAGEMGGGPPPFGKADRSAFLSKLDETISAVKRGS